ncbi:MAG TPA: hypothetical protein VF365_03665 [Candidatus Limnocylindria bacterium]
MTVIYLEADDEVTSVVRRVRAAEPGPVVVVAPGRSRATSSVVALRLLGRAAEADEREVRVVGDALTRSLAAEAGIPAFATLDEARRAAEGPIAASEPRQAEIHVVRGPVTEDTAPTMAAAPVAPLPPPAPRRQPVGEDEMTRPVPVVRPTPVRARPSRRSTGGRVPLAAFGAVAALLIGAVAAGATLLPAATVTIAPRTENIGPVPYSLSIDDPERIAGTATATAEVVATGTYAIQEQAAGSVVFFNWTFFPVNVPAGTFVAAGEQAFATQADVTVPRGRLTGQGTIAAGDAGVAVIAAAPGPAANVSAEAINVVVDEDVDDRLGGVPENPQPRVLNPEPTAGGIDTSGPEIAQADVDAAVEAVRTDLAAQVADATTEEGERIAVAAEPADPVIEGLEDLVGTRDQERVEISGTQAWELFVVDPETVIERGTELFLVDEAVVPPGSELLAGTIAVVIGEQNLQDGTVAVDVTITARAASAIDLEEVRRRIVGRSADEAEAAVADLGDASVELWPGWVTTVPGIAWRVDLRIVDPGALTP